MSVEPLHRQAESNLRFIRERMEHASSFTAVPGWGGVLMGVVGLGAAGLAATRTSPDAWLGVWLAAAAIAFLVGGWAMDRKARAAETSLFIGKGRRFFLSLLPPLVAGAALTPALWFGGAREMIPGTWLLLYGAACVSGGALSTRIVPILGLCFMVLGGLGLLAPGWGDLLLAAGFGGLQIVFGLIIVRRHGG